MSVESQIKAVFLANGFKEKDQGEGRMDLNPYVYDAARELLTDYVRKFKFETLVEHCKRLESDLAQSRAHVNEVTLYQENAVWFWQHDGKDYLESLSCPIIIQPHQMRDILAGAISADVASLQASLTLAREQRDQEIRLNESLRKQIPDAPYTYSSSQSTNCAGCGKHKHTPLRVDSMGGYVCLTCIDTRLEELLAEESAREVDKDWWGCQEVADLPGVDEALKAFSGDSTGDAGVMVVKAVIEALAKPQAPKALELTPDLRWILGQMCFQHIHTAQALRVMGHQIARKAEDEQAVTLHWLLGHYLRDPVSWRANAAEEMRVGAAAEAAKPTEEGAV